MKNLKKSSFSYWYVKIARHKGTPEFIARGIGVGLFCAFGTPVAQMPFAFLFGLMVNGAKIPAMAATWVTNWLTAPLVYPTQLFIGSLVTGSSLSWEKIKSVQAATLEAPTWKESFVALGSLSWDALISFLAGGLVMGIFFGVTGYFSSRVIVAKFQHAKIERKRRKELERAKVMASGQTQSN